MSTPAPITPPNRMLPKAMPLVADLTDMMPGSMPSAAQFTDRSLKLRRTVTLPGEVVNQVPLSLVSWHLAPDTSTPLFFVTTETLWFWPLTIEAHPVDRQAAATMNEIRNMSP